MLRRRTAMMDYHAPRVRVRFAPSPTGALHLGGLRTALFNYFFACKHEGVFVLRIEDTDQTRFTPEAEKNILSGLLWAGLEPDEGPEGGGRYQPYRQSERLLLYAVYAQRLVDQGDAYYAFDTPEEIEAMRKRFATKENPSPRYDASTRGEMANSLALPYAEVCRRLDRGDEHVIRMKVAPGERIAFEDCIRGPVSFASEDIDDQVLIKSDGTPTYHLAHVVDDHAMGITHVIRGEEWLSSTPKHLLLYRCLGWDPPEMAHIPLIMNPGGKGKLSKRHTQANGLPVTVEQCRAAGYEPEAVVNFLARLGWNPGDDRVLFSLDKMAERFSLDRVGGGGVQFDVDKLGWFNQQFLRILSVGGLLGRAAKWGGTDFYTRKDHWERVIALMQSRITFARDLPETCKYLFPDPEFDPESYDESSVQKRWSADSAELLSVYAARLEELSVFDASQAETMLRTLAGEQDAAAARIIHPVRLALSGVSGGPSLFEMMELLGRETCVRRIRKAAETLG